MENKEIIHVRSLRSSVYTGRNEQAIPGHVHIACFSCMITNQPEVVIRLDASCFSKIFINKLEEVTT